MNTGHKLFCSLTLLFSLAAGAQVQKIPVLKCTPSDSSLFAFTLNEMNGCGIIPGQGRICNDTFELEPSHFDQVSKTWSLPGPLTMGLPKTAVGDKSKGTFEYHVAQPRTKIDISVGPGTTSVAINLFVGGQYGMINTRGPQTSYTCELLQ